MNNREWFKVWPKAALISDDLDALNDHEERIWWRLLMVASLEDERWTVANTGRLAAKCKSTPAKLAKALNKFMELGMVRIQGGTVIIANAARYNEDSNRPRRYPSAAPEAVRERVARHRQQAREEDSNDPCNESPVTSVTSRYSNDVTTAVTTATRAREEEEEKEKEEEVRRVPARSRSPQRSGPEPMTAGERQKLVADYGQRFPDLEERIEEALNHVSRKKAVNEYLYVRSWLRRDAPSLRAPVKFERPQFRVPDLSETLAQNAAGERP